MADVGEARQELPSGVLVSLRPRFNPAWTTLVELRMCGGRRQTLTPRQINQSEPTEIWRCGRGEDSTWS